MVNDIQKPASKDKQRGKTSTKTVAPAKSHKLSQRTTLIIVALVVLVSAAGGYAYYRYQSTPAAKERHNIRESEQVIRKIKRRLIIENSETPTVARVTDPQQLKQSNTTFYKNVQTGDYVILYNDQAIIYRWKNDQFINIAPIIKSKK
jgi:flagellar basal body-associated protein FliL